MLSEIIHITKDFFKVISKKGLKERINYYKRKKGLLVIDVIVVVQALKNVI